MSVYAIKRRPRTVAHISPAPFAPSLCGRPVDMTSNAPGGRRVCRDCARRSSPDSGEGDR